LFDEPVNGLDPEGIRWVRTLMRTLAAEGRTVFVSSHLLAEMALMADRLVVIGRGRLIASGGVDEFIKSSRTSAVRLRSPDMERLGLVLGDRGASVQGQPDGSHLVTGMEREQVGNVAHELGARLHELATREATLEEAFLEATGMSEEFIGRPGALTGTPGSYDEGVAR
jgi:ABC-2 type transport system ATP-binding protein